ncbi:sugar ABC transporter ATP-binding protein [Sebaldella sp. S0638]|uniref:sugar ABC transporter ATP-binding protein n=1 Tax=Sebaldella sp. S0638 TaxID=2957809 RepID=UPI0020A1220C|nr:sugar ABC transporter ATP-binding protein [Sebaldella sp. S0638]MCP1223006.1 sugar ABC transporter ATP-binding protein [Sebaldella sp. S0638]
MENNDVLEMLGITKEFPGVKALDNVTLKVKEGTVHSLMGENGAGKSTLMKCLFGIYSLDSGRILFKDEEVNFKNPKEALENGISMIHQELSPVPFRNIIDNIWLGRFKTKRLFGVGVKVVDEKYLYAETEKLLKKLQLDVSPRIEMKDLSVSQMQMVEIAKAISYNAKVIVMDEPTSSLTENEVDKLFEIIKQLKSEGVSIIYISHKMEEILKISDEVSIMRDGKYIGTWAAKELTTDLIISKMVGRELNERFPEKNNIPENEDILRVENLTSINEKSFNNVSFNLKKGEILGLGGLVGAQRTELVEAIFGLRKIKSGKIFLNGKEVNINNPSEAIKNKMALVTEERRATGIFEVLSVKDNVLITTYADLIKYHVAVDDKLGKSITIESIDNLKIKTPDEKTQIRNLSGGNQQKVVFARWLLSSPDILILDEPTRGIDVGAKFEIYNIIIDLAQKGKSIILITSEMSELLGLSDRIVVMCEGKKSGILDRKEANQEKIMELATKYM